MRKIESYRFKDGITPLNEKELNDRFFDVDLRLFAIENVKTQWEEAVAGLQNNGLQRLNEVVMPLVSSVQSLANDIAIQAQSEAAAGITYNVNGMVEEVAYSINNMVYSIGYSYDAGGNALTETARLDGSLLWTRTYMYDQQGNITGWTVQRQEV